MFIIKLISTCFGHHYAHHQENKSVHWFLSLHPTFMMHGHKSLKNWQFTVRVRERERK